MKYAFMKSIIVLALLTIIISCSPNENPNVDTDLEFAKVEKEFQMKQPFSEIGKQKILDKYKTVDNYLSFVNERKAQLNSNQSDLRTLSTFKVRLYNHSHGLDDEIDCGDDVYILEAAEENGIELPFSDRAGASSSCAAYLNAGRVDQSDQSFLDNDQIEAGFVLLCVAYPMQDCDLTTHVEEWIY
jgi:ferredoxin